MQQGPRTQIVRDFQTTRGAYLIGANLRGYPHVARCYIFLSMYLFLVRILSTKHTRLKERHPQ